MEDSPLNRLPAEIRNHIYDLALNAGGCQHQFRPHYHLGLRNGDRLVDNRLPGLCPPPLTQTCRQVRTETLQMYYSAQSQFEVVIQRQDVSKLAIWIAGTSPATACHMQRVRIVSLLGCPAQGHLRRRWRALCRALVAAGVADSSVEWTVRETGGLAWLVSDDPVIVKREMVFQQEMAQMMQDARREATSSSGYAFLCRALWG